MPEAPERSILRANATETLASVSARVPGKRMRPLTTGCPTTGRPVCVAVAVALGEVEVVAVGNAVGRVAVGLLEAAAEALTERVAAEALATLDCRCVVVEAGLPVRAWDTVCVGLCAEDSEEEAEGVGVRLCVLDGDGVAVPGAVPLAVEDGEGVGLAVPPPPARRAVGLSDWEAEGEPLALRQGVGVDAGGVALGVGRPLAVISSDVLVARTVSVRCALAGAVGLPAEGLPLGAPEAVPHALPLGLAEGAPLGLATGTAEAVAFKDALPK